MIMKNLVSGLVGVGIGVLLGGYAQKYATSAHGRKMRGDVSRLMREKERDAEKIVEKAREKAAHIGVGVADKVSQGIHHVAGRVDHMKNQIHDLAHE